LTGSDPVSVNGVRPIAGSCCKKDGSDRLYGEADPVYIDEDVRTEYWSTIRGAPERKDESIANR
jgi:hypothetical protein